MGYKNFKVSVMPTLRDFSLHQSLYDNTLLSFPQIARLHFTDRSKPTVINRLTKLEQAELITRLKVPRLQLVSAAHVISVVYQITRFGISVLQKRLPEIELRPEPVRLRPYSIDHDLLLVDVLAAFKIRYEGFKIVNGELYNAVASSNGLKPDAVLINPHGNQKMALELELTAKSEKRYRELILKYRLSKDFNKVLYVTNQKQIETKIKTILGHAIASERFEFLTLDDVLKTKSERPINNLAEPIAQEGGLV
jgi:DNA-binding Lrp family transcriptional regulator